MYSNIRRHVCSCTIFGKFKAFIFFLLNNTGQSLPKEDKEEKDYICGTSKFVHISYLSPGSSLLQSTQMKTTTAMMMMSVNDWQHEYQTRRSAKYISNTAFSCIKFLLDIFYQVKVVKASEAIRSRRHVQTQGYRIDSITIVLGLKF